MIRSWTFVIDGQWIAVIYEILVYMYICYIRELKVKRVASPIFSVSLVIIEDRIHSDESREGEYKFYYIEYN